VVRLSPKCLPSPTQASTCCGRSADSGAGVSFSCPACCCSFRSPSCLVTCWPRKSCAAVSIQLLASPCAFILSGCFPFLESPSARSMARPSTKGLPLLSLSSPCLCTPCSPCADSCRKHWLRATRRNVACQTKKKGLYSSEH
jgi:hypothetical protein